MRIFTASFATETNTFSPIPTGTKSFSVTRKGDYSTFPPFKDSVPALWRKWGEADGHTILESLIALAEPAGKTLQATYETFRDEILADLQEALPVDAVLLDLHGAMVAYGYDDCEGDLIARIRQIVGAEVAIGVELDLHCHLTETMVENATVIITYKDYPHTDFGERAEELYKLIVATAEGKVKPVMAMFDCQMNSLYYPTQEPLKSYVEKMKSLEGHDGILSVSLGHGFPWGDVPFLGAKTLVVADNDLSSATELAQSLGMEMYTMRNEARPQFLNIDEAIDTALSIEGQPVVLADVSDNPGGGAPGDSTYILSRLLERGITNVAIGCIFDPMAVQLAIEAGEGADIELRIGGKMGKSSGSPVDVTAKVGKITYDAIQHFGPVETQQSFVMGDSVAITANGIDIVLYSMRGQTFSPEVFTNVGIDPFQKKILVVKSTQHFYARFAPIATRVIYVGAPGAVAPEFESIPYEHAGLHRWPNVDNPLGV